MSSTAITPNNHEIIAARDTISGRANYLTSTSQRLNVNATITGSVTTAGTISDGVDPSILATVFDLSNSNPLATQIVDGSGTAITSFGGGTQYAELATTSPGTGTLSLGRYKSSAPTLTDGQMYGIQLDASGNLKVNVTNGASGGTSSTDNSAFTAGTTSGTPSMGFYHSTIDTVTDGRTATIGMTSKRGMFVNLQTSAGAETGVAAVPLQVSLANTATNGTAVKVDGTGGTFPISGTVAVTQSTSPWIVAGSGTAGSAASGVVTIQGISSMTPVQVSQATASNLNATIVSGNATGSAVPTGAYYIGGLNAAGNLEGVRNAAATMNTTTGQLATAITAVFDDTSPTAITENQFGTVRMSANRNLYGTIRDAAGNERGVNVNSSNQLSVSVDNNPVIGVGTNSIGKISDITTSVTPGTAAANLGKAEDAGHASGDTGVMSLAVRNDGAATSFSNTDADYTPVAVDAQGRSYVTQKAPTATLSNVSGAASSTTLIAANTARLGVQIFNDSTVNCYVKHGSSASSTSFTVKMLPYDYYELPFGYTGIITGIWDSATGTARVTETT